MPSKSVVATARRAVLIRLALQHVAASQRAPECMQRPRARARSRSLRPHTHSHTSHTWTQSQRHACRYQKQNHVPRIFSRIWTLLRAFVLCELHDKETHGRHPTNGGWVTGTVAPAIWFCSCAPGDMHMLNT